MASPRNRHHSLTVDLGPSLFVAHPLKLIGTAQRLSEKLFKYFGQWTLEQMQQGQRELVDSNIVVFKPGPWLAQGPGVAFFAIGLAGLVS